MGNVHARLLDKQQPQINDILTGGDYRYPSCFAPPGFDFPICLVFFTIPPKFPVNWTHAVLDTFSLQP